MDEKRCSKCGGTKPTGEFYAMRAARDGLRPSCKACSDAQTAAYRAAHPDVIRAISRRAYAKDPEKERQRKKRERAGASGERIREAGRNRMRARRAARKAQQ